jgi:hypothetical protein
MGRSGAYTRNRRGEKGKTAAAKRSARGGLWTLSQPPSAKKGIRVDFEHAHPFPLPHLLGRKRGIFVLVANEIAEEDWRQ